MDWLAELKAEYEKAEKARANGNEGQARVCARRAAGIASREYFARRCARPRTASAYDLLGLVSRDKSLPPDLREAAARLTLRVDEDFTLPAELDLIVEAKRLIDGLAKLPEP